VPDIKATMRKFIDEAVNKGNLNAADGLIPDSYVFHGADGKAITGIDAYKKFLGGVRASFPDIKYVIDDIAVDGNVMAIRASFTATHSVPIGNAAPTGNKVSMVEALFFRLENGKPVEEWQYLNQLSLMKQISPKK
jgi:predicted ester cyclase